MNGKWIDQFPPEREYDLEIDEDTYELQMADAEIAQAAADRAEAAAAIAVEKATDISNQVNQATEGARVATQKATEAGNYANGAEVSARVAVQNKNEAEQAKNLAITAKNDTQAIKEEVEQIIEGIDEAGAAANASAQAAANSATSASGSASQAAQAKIDAQTARDEAIEAAQNAQAAADTALDTQNMIATVETTEIASKDYAVDDLLIYEGVLYKVSDIITLGDTLIPNSNIEETTVKESINNAVPSWAKASTKPSYTASEVGAPTVQEMNTAIGTAISNINSFDMAVVQTLPSENISTHTIYLVPKTGETNDVYDEYIYVNNNWEMIGNTQIDLSGYATKSEIPDTSIYVTKESIDNAGIKSSTYSQKFGGAFSVTTTASADYIKPHARASVTGRFDKTELHRVMVNGTEYVLRTRLWYKGNKVYEYLGNLALYVSDVSGVPGGTDNVPFVIISDLDETDTIDVLTDVAGTYEILVEVITPSQVLLPKSLIWGDAYVPIEKANGSGTYNGFSLGVNELTSKRGTFALGYGNKISGNFGVAIGTDNTVSNVYGIAVGAGNTVSGQDGHAEGFENSASGKMSHVEGQRSEASGIISHAEGNYTVASGNVAHAEGQRSVASGAIAHAEGDRSEASGSRSHAEGSYTVANHFAQHVSGQYNVPDPSTAAATERGTYVEIVGNGTSDEDRSNARTLDWNGNERLAGGLTLHAGSENEVDVASEISDMHQQFGGMIASVETGDTASKDYTVGELVVFNNQLCKVITAIALGDTIILDGNVEQTTVEQEMENAGSGVSDVQVNGSSIVNNGVANVPIANASRWGVVRSDADYGTQNLDDRIAIQKAADDQIKTGKQNYRPIVSSNQHISTFYGLAKAAGADEKNSSLALGQYTENAKSAIHDMLNAPVAVTGTTPTIAAKSGISYKCGEVSTLDITLPASGCIDVIFESGSTPTVLTVTPPTGVTLKWANGFDPDSLEANTVYEINICDGLGVAASWT